MTTRCFCCCCSWYPFYRRDIFREWHFLIWLYACKAFHSRYIQTFFVWCYYLIHRLQPPDKDCIRAGWFWACTQPMGANLLSPLVILFWRLFSVNFFTKRLQNTFEYVICHMEASLHRPQSVKLDQHRHLWFTPLYVPLIINYLICFNAVSKLTHSSDNPQNEVIQHEEQFSRECSYVT